MALQLENIKSEIPIEVVDIDVDPEIAIEYAVRSVPTLVMMDDGQIIKKLVGVKTPTELGRWIND